MELKINGKWEQVVNVRTISELLTARGLHGQQLVVEHNGQIVKGDSWNEVVLEERDELEILRLVGGG